MKISVCMATYNGEPFIREQLSSILPLLSDEDELIISDEIFLTGTAAEITPIISMDSKKIGNGKPGDITKKMMQEYLDIVMNKNIDYAHWLTEVY